ncbi:MAG: hypothetical protein ACTSX8_08485 [Alphaproteobacteria bacterium]
MDIGAQLRVYDRGPGDKPVPGVLLDRVYGGRYDSWQKRYIGPPEHIVELSCHPGQVELLTFEDSKILRVLALGAKGGGKTDGIVRRAILNALVAPGKPHGIIAPTSKRMRICWKKVLDIIGPLGWVQDIKASDDEILLINGATLVFFAAKRQSAALGSPIAGWDLHTAVEDEQQNIDDESLQEVDARGRINSAYQVFSAASNEAIPVFQERVREYKRSDRKRVITFDCYSNSFTPLAHWEKLKATWPDDVWERIMLGIDAPISGRVYPAFSMQESVIPRPVLGKEVTQDICKIRYGEFYDYIIGSDFGTLKSASVVMKAYKDPKGGREDRIWWAIDELVTIGKTVDWHVNALLERYPMIDELQRPNFVMVSMPHVNASQAGKKERTDYHIVRKKGLHIVSAAGKPITRHHRFSMVNSLLHAADKKRRLFIDSDEHGRSRCPELVKSLYGYMLKDVGLKKDSRDLSDASDAMGYALFPWERIRGMQNVQELGANVGRS